MFFGTGGLLAEGPLQDGFWILSHRSFSAWVITNHVTALCALCAFALTASYFFGCGLVAGALFADLTGVVRWRGCYAVAVVFLVHCGQRCADSQQCADGQHNLGE